MKIVRLTLSLAALSAFALACPASKKTPTDAPPEAPASQPAGSSAGLSAKDRDAVDPDGVVRRGVALSDAEPMTVEQAWEKAPALSGQTVKVTGTVEKVCQKSGCWFVLDGGDDDIRITSKGYKYFVPSDAEGMTAVVEGELEVKTLDVETAQHYADDAAEATGEPAEKVEAPVKEIAIASVGLEMRK